ncbi:MAG: hypothetical protein GY839_04125 [candidate division Zixibacteria bacterium]|nr:hypothetical protein [candidate division Zixibacteria bacterium]
MAQIGILAICIILPLFLVTDYYVLPFVMLIAVIGGLVILKKPFIGLLIYLLIFYVRPQEIWFTQVVALEKTIGIAMLVLTFLKLKMQDDFKFNITGVHYAVAGFVLAMLLTVSTSIWISRSWEVWVKAIRLLIVFFCVIHLVDTEKQFKFFILYTILGTAFHATSAVVNYYNGIRKVEMGIERAFAMDTSLGDPNSLAATIIYTLPLIYYYFTKKTSISIRILLFGISLIALWCIVLTGSRTGMSGVLVFGMLIIWERRHKIRNFIVIASLLIIGWVIMPDQYKERFISVTDMDTSEDATGAAVSARSRYEFLKYGFVMLMDRPIYGYGPGNFSTAMGTIYGNTWLQAHTLPAQLMSEMGLLGIISFGFWIYLLAANIKRLKSHFKSTGNIFMLNMTLAMKAHIWLLFFMGVGGHNLYRYNWYILSAIVVMMMKEGISGFGKTETGGRKIQELEPGKMLSEATEEGN